MEQVVGAILIAALFIALNAFVRLIHRDGGWHEHLSLKGERKMRRWRRDGSWQYRDLTDEEETERQGFQV